MKEVLITLDGKYIDETEVVVATLTKEGLQVKRVYQPLGVISGSVQESAIHRLRAHKEVASVKEQQRVRIAPPYKSVQ